MVELDSFPVAGSSAFLPIPSNLVRIAPRQYPKPKVSLTGRKEGIIHQLTKDSGVCGSLGRHLQARIC